MSQLNPARTLSLVEDPTPTATTADTLPTDLARLLESAAKVATVHDLEPDQFIRAAWSALLAARPELREQHEVKQLRIELRKLRKRGLIGQA